MEPACILFEDQSAEDFRPLSWSLPVYEIRCGLFNLRERVQCWAEPARLGLLPRGLLLSLQALTAPSGVAVGAEACRTRVAAGGAVFLNARLGADWRLLEAVLAPDTPPCWAVWDGDALLGCRLSAAASTAFVAAWETWDGATEVAGPWTAAGGRAPRLDVGHIRRCPALLEGRAADKAAEGEPPRVFAHVWDIVHALGPALTADARRLCGAGVCPGRRPFGIAPDEAAWPDGTPWERPTTFAAWQPPAGVHAMGGPIWGAPEVRVDPGAVLDAEHGPIVLDRGVRVQPHAYLQGPLYLGAGTVVKAGARIYGETSIGAVCRVAGEIGESLCLDFVNKQHDGFLGHAALGSWVNLGAATTCSDLKNNYGPVRVDYGLGEVDSGLRFVGLMMGEHAKSAIGTVFNTGTVVGFASNVFGAGFPPKFLPNFTWGDPAGPRYATERAIEVARIVMSRRGCRLLPAHEALFRALGAQA